MSEEGTTEVTMNTPRSSGAGGQRSWFRRHPIWSAFLAIVGVLVVFLLLMTFLPVTVDDTSVSNPATGHEDAIARIEAIQAEEEASGEVNPLCYSNVLSHGEKTAQVIVFYHGFTSCPEQFRELGKAFFEQGYNVYIPRMPHHGEVDRLASAMIDTSAEELAAFDTQSIDIARGLGEELTVAGLSGGGTLAAWTAQKHDDVDRVVMMAPFLGIGFIPTVLNRTVARIIDDIPNIWMWWDPQTKEENPFTAPYAYPRYPLHALAEYLRLGFAAQQDARRNKPSVNNIVVITNANDDSVDNNITAQFVASWKAHDEEYLSTYEFERRFNLPHDLITPTREDGNPRLVYPIIMQSLRPSGE